MLLVLGDRISEVVARRPLLNKRYCHSILSQVGQLWHKRIICDYTSVWCPEEDKATGSSMRRFAVTDGLLLSGQIATSSHPHQGSVSVDA
jgi:hypothetical protein